MKMNLSYGIFLLFGIFLASFVLWNSVFAQLPSATGIGVIINTPSDSANLPTGDLTIYGTSSDSNTTDCQVFADWNDLKPMQSVTANGPKGDSDYSKWSFTYTSGYHGIVEGPNELTSKITCIEQGQNASSKSYSINVTGIGDTHEITNNITQKSTEIVDTEDLGIKENNIMPANSDTSTIDSANDTVQSTEDVGILPNGDNNIMPANSDTSNTDSTNDTVQSTEDVDIEDVDIEDVDIEDVSNEDVSNEDVSNEDVANENADVEDVSNEDAGIEDTNIMQANSDTSNTDSTNDTVQSTEDVDIEDVANEDTDNESTDILPANDNRDNGTYKILPLYSESDEESTNSVSSDDTDQTGIRNMNTFEPQNGLTSGDTFDTGSGNYATSNLEQQGAIGETNNFDMTSQSEPSTFFTYEPDLVEDTSNHDEVNTHNTNPQSENSFPSHEIDDTSIFGLKFNGIDDVTQNKIEKRIEKLEDRITDRMSMFDLIG
ncbi:MAG TPA: hypothetical protein VJ772_06165 [Nitrososphaeraceae archaeon]|nr:hypothetical protein [Nitrososphaeraceae archaeon]